MSSLVKNTQSQSSISRSEAIKLVQETAEEVLKNLAHGKDSSMAKMECEILLTNVKGVELPENKGKIVEIDFGRKLYEAVQRMIECGGEELKIVTETNFPLSAYLRKRRVLITELEDQIEHYETVVLDSAEKPDREVFEMRAEVEKTRRTESLQGKLDANEIDADEFEASKKIMVQEIKLAWREDYLNKLDEYEASAKSIKESLKAKKDFEKTQKKEVVLEILLQGLNNAMSLIVNRIKSHVAQVPTVKVVLQGIIEIETTSEVLSNPLDENILSGIVQILFQTYHKTSFVNFNNELMDING